ncbi:ABC transporter substrate-binding protein [Rhodobacter capsulatus]|uniref:ABC transporter substrate-binding protein n=1 Tax=Rhodobacter capsulatus TaxID=1061 RepID=UPI0003D2EFF8|nr:ABC transporter substrate-binding protein [Rhodobacter capsulatus]ETD87281.1 hypothetical protein U713_16990 [Rhodobacter capsulatus YW2]
MMKRLTLSALALLLAATSAGAENWSETLAKARGQTVYWNAWGGDVRTNDFIAWVGDQVAAHYGVTVKQVKLGDTSEAVTRVIAEKAAGKTSGGSVDLIWINGPNFLSMKSQGLLYGPFAETLPNARYLDLSPGSAATVDFTIPVEGHESAWRLAQFVFSYDSARISDPPRTIADFPDWAAAHPGRFTHPDASNFIGTTFLKQALIALAPDPAALSQPATDESYAKEAAPLWAWYDRLRPNLWRAGREFPANEVVQQQLLDDGEIDITMAFDPAAAAAAVERGLLPESVRSYALTGGSLGNISFVAIPFNATAKEGAQVVADFLLDPATQAHAQDIRILGSYSVLDHGKLDAAQKAAFDALPKAPALPRSEDLGRPLPEPHPSWTTRLAADWAARVAQ